MEWIELVEDVTLGRDGLRILGFWKRRGVDVWPSKRPIEFFGSNQIRSDWASTGRDETQQDAQLVGVGVGGISA